MNFKKVEDELPAYGEPVLIRTGSTVQHITYMLDGADDVPDWFEPYFFESEDGLKICHSKVREWAYLPE